MIFSYKPEIQIVILYDNQKSIFFNKTIMMKKEFKKYNYIHNTIDFKYDILNNRFVLLISFCIICLTFMGHNN